MSSGSARMMLGTVDLQDESAVNDEVHAPDSGKRDLAIEAKTEQMQTQSEEGLQTAIGVDSGEVDQPPRRRGDAPAQTRRGSDLPLPQGRFESSEESLVSMTAKNVYEDVFDGGQPQGRRTAVPVTDAFASVVMQTPVRAHPDMEGGCLIQRPDSVKTQGRHARDGPAMLGGGNDLARGVREDEHTRTHS